jgi:signal peptidase II
MNLKKAYFIVFLVLAIDQISKIYVKTHFLLGEEVEVFKWFKIHFIGVQKYRVFTENFF